MSGEKIEIMQEPEKTRLWNAQRLIYQRTDSGLSHKQLAEAMGIQPAQIICMEKCTRIPSKEMLDMLVSFFDVPEDYFGVEASDGVIDPRNRKLSQQEERRQTAQEELLKQRRSLRRIMKTAGFPLNCSGLHSLAAAIDEPVSDICRFVNGEIRMPSDVVQRTNAWISSIRKI